MAWIGKLYFLDIKNNQTFLLNVYRSTMLVGHRFPVASVQTAHGDTVRTDFSGTMGGLVVLFDPTACQPCLELVLNGLQHIKNNLTDASQLPVYAIAKSVPLERLWQLRRAFRLDYPLGIVAQDDILLDTFFKKTPLVLLIDEHNTILQCHYPIYGKEQFSAIFFTRLVFNHLPPLKVNIEAFKNSPLNALRHVPLLDVAQGHYTSDDPFRDL
jgi:hypothetical protein